MTGAGVSEISVSLQNLLLIVITIEIERMYSNGPICQVSMFGELLSNAIQSSHQWRKERGLGESTTNCWTTMIPRDPNEDISITIWLGRRDGHRVNTALMVEPTWSSPSLPMPE